MNFLRNLNNSLFKKHLLLTNTVSSGILLAMGDGISQYIEHKLEQPTKDEKHMRMQFNWDRNFKMFVVGTAGGPLHHYFYAWLDIKYPGATLRTTTIEILYDQFVMAPLCIVLFFYSAGWMYGQSNANCWNELKSKIAVILIADWMVWPGAQFLNFYYLNPNYRVLYVNFVTMLYDVFLSYIKHIDPNLKNSHFFNHSYLKP